MEGPTTPLPDLEALGTARLRPLFGVEHGVGEVARALHAFARSTGARRTGAMLVTCADATEQECAEAFRQGFADHLLPSLKFRQRSVFRLANLGARYEWGAVAIAEQHFATERAIAPFKLFLIKVNTHVGFSRGPHGPRFGGLVRYGVPSIACGALHAVLDGSTLPLAAEIAEAFGSEGLDRLAVLKDPERVDRNRRALYAALAHARLQARRALVDLQDRPPASPTLYAVVPSVTLNRDGEDGEIVCGLYAADWCGAEPRIAYVGLGDDPAAYRLDTRARLRVEDDELHRARPARDHRRHVAELWRSRERPVAFATPGAGEAAGAAASAPPAARPAVAELAGVAAEARSGHRNPRHAAAMLRLALKIAAELNPVTAAVALFTEGVADIHHLYRVHRIIRGLDSDREARELIHGVEQQIDTLPPRRAREMVQLLAAEYGAR